MSRRPSTVPPATYEDLLKVPEGKVAEIIDGAEWIDRIAEHLPKLSPHAREAWARMQTLLSSSGI